MTPMTSLLVVWMAWPVSMGVSITVEAERVEQRAEAQRSCWKDTADVKNPDVRGRKLPALPSRLASAKVKKQLVTLKLCIDQTGQVTRSLVLVSSGNEEVDRFYQDEVSRWKLKPVVRKGKPVHSVVNISVSWNVG